MSQTVKASHVALFISIALVIGLLLGVWLAPSSKGDNEMLDDGPQVNKTNKMTEIMQLIPTNRWRNVQYNFCCNIWIHTRYMCQN